MRRDDLDKLAFEKQTAGLQPFPEVEQPAHLKLTNDVGGRHDPALVKQIEQGHGRIRTVIDLVRAPNGDIERRVQVFSPGEPISPQNLSGTLQNLDNLMQ